VGRSRVTNRLVVECETPYGHPISVKVSLASWGRMVDHLTLSGGGFAGGNGDVLIEIGIGLLHAAGLCRIAPASEYEFHFSPGAATRGTSVMSKPDPYKTRAAGLRLLLASIRTGALSGAGNDQWRRGALTWRSTERTSCDRGRGRGRSIAANSPQAHRYVRRTKEDCLTVAANLQNRLDRSRALWVSSSHIS
jgi:hypothetical protein